MRRIERFDWSKLLALFAEDEFILYISEVFAGEAFITKRADE
jgi:hypothetical protein